MQPMNNQSDFKPCITARVTYRVQQINCTSYKCVPRSLLCTTKVFGSHAKPCMPIQYTFTFLHLLWPCFLHWLKSNLFCCWFSIRISAKKLSAINCWDRGLKASFTSTIFLQKYSNNSLYLLQQMPWQSLALNSGMSYVSHR